MRLAQNSKAPLALDAMNNLVPTRLATMRNTRLKALYHVLT